MPVLLRRSAALPGEGSYDRWLAVTGTPGRLAADRRLPDLPRRLQKSFDRVRDDWIDIARRLGGRGVGRLSHTATAAAYINDFGLMLAWSRLVDTLASEAGRTLVLCDDPWLFRHLARRAGVEAGRAPPLANAITALYLRGLASRLRLSLRLAVAATRLGSLRQSTSAGGSFILVYGHPQSDAAGNDAYFGTLMRELPSLGRTLHTDCMPDRARELARDRRTASLHGWGSPWFAARLPFLLWRMPDDLRDVPESWLLKRAIARENGGGALAMTRWQEHCQSRWLTATRPAAVAWPWENHPWERSFARTARRLGVGTIGYQHAVIGRHQFNFSPRSNPDGDDSLPDVIMCNGPAYRQQLEELGHDPGRLRIGGAFRIRREGRAFNDPAGPVYIALSAIRPIAEQMLRAASHPALAGIAFVVKDHPLYPVSFGETDRLKRTPLTIPESDGLRAVVYSTGTTGLEGLLAGVPTYRFLPDERIAPDILPNGISVPEVTAEELPDALLAPRSPQPLDWADIMAPVDLAAWRETLANPDGGPR